MVSNAPGDARLGLGSVQWGQQYGIANTAGQPSSDDVARIIRIAGEAGVRTIDTARDYGTSEALIGELVPRKGWRIVTKLTAQLSASSSDGAVSAASASVAASLAALRETALDTLLLHRLEHMTSWDGAVWRALLALRESGRIHHLGISALGPDEAWLALERPDVDVIQVASNLFDQRLARAGFFEAAIAAGKEVFVRSVFLQGVAHLHPDRLPTHLAALRESLTQTREYAASQGWESFAPFLAFAYGTPGARVLIGAESVAQVRECLAEWRLAPERSEAVRAFAEQILPLPERMLNPWQW
jgi:aryl-alcohol dehydrogenase-like predicted oxidoreductase